jgi:hypothetical protein
LHAGQLAVVWPEMASKAVGLAGGYFLGLAELRRGKRKRKGTRFRW